MTNLYKATEDNSLSLEADNLIAMYVGEIYSAKDEQSLLEIARNAYLDILLKFGVDYAERISKAKDERLAEVDIINKQTDEAVQWIL